MNANSALPPGVGPEDRVVLFDGVCRLCSAWARFLIRFDTNRQFRMATVQSLEGLAILEWHGLPTDSYETMLFVEGSRVYTQSTAFFQVMRRLPFPWPIFCAGWIVPKFLRDWLYDRVALNRYALFGRYETCIIPTSDHDSRFLGA